MHKKKLLIVTSRYLFPVIGGDRLRIYAICKELSKFYDLTLVCLSENRAVLSDNLVFDPVFAKVKIIYQPLWRSWFQCAINIFSKKPLQVSYYENKELCCYLNSIQDEYDGVVAHLIRTSEAVRKLRIPKFLEMTDAISLNYSRVNFSFNLKKLIFIYERKKLIKYERYIVKHFNKSILISRIDFQYLFPNGYDANKLLVSSNGVDTDNIKYEFNRNSRCIIFLGNMCSMQNLDAAKFLVNEIFPIVQQVISNVNLYLVGRINNTDALAFEASSGVVVTRELENIEKFMRNGGVAVCPVRIGAGVQNKLLEYMAYGLPSVSTGVGLEGIDAEDGVHLLVANTAEDIASSVTKLINNRSYAESIAYQARLFVEQNYSWHSRLDPIVASINEEISN